MSKKEKGKLVKIGTCIPNAMKLYAHVTAEL